VVVGYAKFCCFVSTVMTCPWIQMGKLEDVCVFFMLDNLHLFLVSVFILIRTHITNFDVIFLILKLNPLLFKVNRIRV